MDKQSRLAMYRVVIMQGHMLRGCSFDIEKIEAAAMAMLRGEALDVSGECDAGPCCEPKESGSKWCKGHGARR